MSYEKTNWQKGDVITAEKLNNIENGIEANETAIGNNVFIVNVVAKDNGNTITATADKTRQEMSAAVEADKLIIIRLVYSYLAQQPSQIHEMTPTILPSTLASGYNFAAEKILHIDDPSKSIDTAKVAIGSYKDPDIIAVSFPTYSFA